jgi:hypothetical protein
MTDAQRFILAAVRENKVDIARQVHTLILLIDYVLTNEQTLQANKELLSTTLDGFYHVRSYFLIIMLGHSLLHAAASLGRVEMCGVLIQAGIDVNVQNRR